MGLCECSRKKVTNLYCFEHRVTVCEHCIVETHQKCIVQSYLQWLNDCDYNPVCQLCKKNLESMDCVRLVCLDLFHTECLDNWGKNMPSNTAPAGYRCPVCASVIFPAPNVVSPIAEVLRTVLSTFSWTGHGLGMPLVPSLDNKMENKKSPTLQNNSNGYSNIGIQQEALLHRFDGTTKHHHHSVLVDNLQPSRERPDDEDLKYHRKSTTDWIRHWMRTLNKPSPRGFQRYFKGPTGFVLLVFVVLATLMFLMFLLRHLTRVTDDPMLDPLNNPNIKVVD